MRLREKVVELQKMNLQYSAGPSELLEHEAGALHRYIGRKVAIKADTIGLYGWKIAEILNGETLVYRSFEARGSLGAAEVFFGRESKKVLSVCEWAILIIFLLTILKGRVLSGMRVIL